MYSERSTPGRSTPGKVNTRKFIYDPYSIEHGWQARVDKYTHPQYGTRAAQLAWLRQQWRDNGPAKQKLLVIAKQVKSYGWRRAFKSWLPPLPCEQTIIKQAVQGLLAKGIV